MTATATSAALSFVLLPLGVRRFALPAECVVELVAPTLIHQFPHMTPLLTGVILRRGWLVPVCDVAERLGSVGSWAQRFYLLVRPPSVEGNEPIAIPVSGACEMTEGEFSAAGAETPPYVAGHLSVGAESVAVLDLAKLLQPLAEGSPRSPVDSEEVAR